MPKKKNSYIDGYRILRVLGRGGMGTVYLCEDPELNREVAIKVLDIKRARRDREAMRLRFIREAKTTARLQHPSIPPVYSVSKNDRGQLYYVMKPIEGRPLSEIIGHLLDNDKKTVSEYDLYRMVEILRDVSRAIQYAHSRHYIHRDIKPDNIFVGDYGEVYVIDWGLTKALGITRVIQPAQENDLDTEFDFAETESDTETVSISDSTLSDECRIDESEPEAEDVNSPLTATGDVLGTLAYMPPEQASGNSVFSGAEADIYAMGVILYEILTLTLPVSGDTIREIISRKLKGDIVKPELASPDREVPPELSAITMQAMSPNPEERFASASDFTSALEFWLEGKSLFRSVVRKIPDAGEFHLIPRSAAANWTMGKDTIITEKRRAEDHSILLLKREFAGDLRFSASIMIRPVNEDLGDMPEFSLLMNASVQRPWKGFVDGYAVHLGAGKNTRAYLSRNGSEVDASEFVVLEPWRIYRITIERIGNDIRVLLDRHTILRYQDSDPPTGTEIGFEHRGEGVEISNLRVQTRGMPTNISAIEAPEALMAEGCYEAAFKRFMAIAVAHKNRQIGAWARHRAGLAAYLQDHNRQRATRVWTPLKKSPYSVYEILGRAKVEIVNGRLVKAAHTLESVFKSGEALTNLEPVADMAMEVFQKCMRAENRQHRDWRAIDAWSKIALQLGCRVESKRSITPAVLWQWLHLALTRFPHHLPDCLVFLRETFGKGQGAFAEVLTTIDPLMKILTRSVEMADNAYLTGKIMRLVLFHDDRLGNFETLARFYLHAGHEDVALSICKYICRICRENNYDIPPLPITFRASMEWLHGDPEKAGKLFGLMAEHSSSWAKIDGLIFLGLDHYARGEKDIARLRWRSVLGNSSAAGHSRNLVVKGLLGELPPDPVAAGVPNRTDHRLLYCLFLGYRCYLDWKRTLEAGHRKEAVSLLSRAFDLTRPSYDFYSATDTLSRIPLEEMGHPLPPRKEPGEISKEEQQWLQDLAVADSEEEPQEKGRSSTGRRKASSRRRE